MSRYSYYSVIVPSFNRKQEIEELIASFRKLDFPSDRFELIIADDGSDDGTEQLVSQWERKVPFSLRFFRQPQNRGPGAARNLGMEKARGDFFIFIDSDCTVSPGWLKAIDMALSRERADAFGGPDAGREDFPPLLKAIDYAMTSFVTTGGIRGHKKKKLGKYYPRSFNMGLSREVYETIGGFGSLRHGQDIEYSHRIIQSGAKVILIPEAIVYHKRRTSLKKFFRQVFNWGAARVNLYKLDARLLEPVHLLPAIVTLLLFLMALGSLFSALIWKAFSYLLLLGAAVLFLAGVHAALKHKNSRLFYLAPLVMVLQVFGYGLGFLAAFVSRVLLGRGEFVGFRKKYYQ